MRAAAIMREDEAQDRDAAGLDIDLDLGDGGAVGIGHVVDDDVLGRLEPRRDARRQAVSRQCPRRRARRRQALTPSAGAALDA